MSKNIFFPFAAILTSGLILTSCSDDDVIEVVTPDQPVALNCEKPAYLKAGDKGALISPSYFTPMGNVEKTADVLRSWGLQPVMGANVTIDVRNDGATLQFNIDGEQQQDYSQR